MPRNLWTSLPQGAELGHVAASRGPALGSAGTPSVPPAGVSANVSPAQVAPAGASPGSGPVGVGWWISIWRAVEGGTRILPRYYGDRSCTDNLEAGACWAAQAGLEPGEAPAGEPGRAGAAKLCLGGGKWQGGEGLWGRDSH